MTDIKENVIYLTEEGLKKLQQELVDLKETKRVEIAEKLKEAISFGDLSENSEYEDARSEQAQVELRITDLEDQLKRVEIIKEGGSKTANKVSMGTIVTMTNIESKEDEVYKIVGTTEASILDPETPSISNESPVGQAILGKKKGENVKIKAPSGVVHEYKIKSFK